MARVVALALPKSGNEKTGPVAVTYAGTATCPSACPMKDGNGCYYESGFRTRPINERLNVASAGLTPRQAAQEEARLIDRLFPRGVPDARAMRLHVGGDARTNGAALVLSDAAERWRQRGGGPVWTYTHAWRSVEREFWGKVSVLASVESAQDGMRAIAKGYAPARVVSSFPNGKRAWDEAGVRWIPCPAQTHEDVRCVDCKLCWDAPSLRARGAGIAFEAHGGTAKRAARVADGKRRLSVVA